MASEALDEKAIFNVARQIGSPDTRADYLRQACGGDSGLRERVQVLLRAYEEQASFLESPPPVGVAPTIDQPVSESAGTVIGAYKLVEPIGEGGMGTVWMAQQTEPVKRRVALKLIKPGMDSKQVIARFEAERQALALMDHPNIAKVLDGGTTSTGRPYFVMDLVKGEPITKYCDEHHLTPRQRLELLVPVCHAVQHAHQKGIIHRDLKPSNVLVAQYDGRPVPKVIDFGVAKAAGQPLTEQTLVTGFGAIVGTPEYMSPEQAEVSQIDIDTRSDIYSLGVLLYELLTGSPPFTRKELEKAGILEMLRVIREDEPSKPSTKLCSSEALPTLSANRSTEPAKLTKLVRGELDWIVMKALDKDRNRRYETANGFAMDVQRYLADEPVQACPPSAGYRLKKFVRRNKGRVLAASLVLLALVAGIVGTTWQAIRAAHRAEGERLAKERAVANFAIANEAVEKYLGTVTNDRDLRRADFHRLRKSLLESAIPFFQKLTEQKSDEPEFESGRGRAYQRLARVRHALGENEAALQDFEAARAVFARLATDFPTVPAYRDGLAVSLVGLGITLAQLGKRRESEAVLRQALDVNEKLAADFPAEPAYRHKVSTSHNNLGNLLAEIGKCGEADAAYRQAVAIQAKLVADFPAMPEYRHILAASHNNLGNLLVELGKRGEAEAAYRQALEIHAQLAADSPADPEYRQDLAMSHNNLGALLDDLGKRGEAEAAYRQALDINEKLAAEFPTVPAYRLDLATSHNHLGLLLKDLGKRAVAEAALRQAVAIHAKLAADFPIVPEYRQVLATSHNNLGDLLMDLGKRGEAEAAYRRALDIQEKFADEFPAVPEYRQQLARSHRNLGTVLDDLRKPGEAEAAYRRALGIEEKLVADFPAVPEYGVGLAGSYCNFGHLIRDTGQPEAALGWYQKAITTLKPVVEKEPRLVDARRFLCNSHQGRATALDALGRHDDATLDWDRALELDDGSNKLNYRLRISRNKKDAASCLAIASDYEAQKPTDAGAIYDVARSRAVCAAVIPQDPKIPAADTAQLAKEQADSAMGWLRKAVDAGFRDVEQMKRDQDLDALRKREDFKKLLAELEAKQK